MLLRESRSFIIIALCTASNKKGAEAEDFLAADHLLRYVPGFVNILAFERMESSSPGVFSGGAI